MTVNFEGGADDIPTFSFADLRFCATGNDKEYFRHWFDGKVVIFGSVLDAEDRRLTSKRFATGREGARMPRCTAETKPVNVGFKRSSIAGVYIHATAVNNIVRQDAAIELGGLPIFLIATWSRGCGHRRAAGQADQRGFHLCCVRRSRRRGRGRSV